MKAQCLLSISRRLAMVVGAADIDGNPVVQSISGHWQVIGTLGT